MQRLMERLTAAERHYRRPGARRRETIIEIVTDNMMSVGPEPHRLARTPEEIADRYLEKQALDAVADPRGAGGSCWSTISR